MTAHTRILAVEEHNVAHATPEQRLFLSVILNAVADASGRACVQDRSSEGDRLRTKARAWFREGGPDFEEVCALAGLHPHDVQHGVLDYLHRVADDPNTIVARRRGNHRPRLHAPTTDVTKAAVARHAGVSATTVNRVLGNSPSVLPETRDRVQAAIKALGFKAAPEESMPHGH